MGSPHSILIVEDESIVSMDLEMNLERLGYAVSGIATSSEEAIEEIQRVRPDLVLMDIQLHGGIDGLTTAEMIYGQFGIPTIFVTANADDEAIARSRQSGSYGFLNKPFRPSELNATIEIALHQHHAGQELSVENERLEQKVLVTSEALGQTREDLQALSRHLMQVQEVERSRIARELHDDLGQQAALISMQADILDQELPEECKSKMTALRASLNQLSKGLREVSHKLHPSIIADLGLTDALDALIVDFRAQGLSIQASLVNVGDVALDVSTALYRIAQESLSNVLKHAASSSVRVILTSSETELALRIADNGPSFSLSEIKGRSGLGLISMQERVHLVGGTLRLTALPNRGTTVMVRVPLSR